MPAPLLAPAGQLQGWIIRPRWRVRRHYRCLSQIVLSDALLAWHRQACGGSAQGRPGGAGARDDDG